MKHTRFQAVLVIFFLLSGLGGCGNRTETAFVDGPKGYVEFYMPEPGLGEESLGIDVQVYRIENGKREFLGMTQKWKHLAEPRRGLTVAAPPGRQAFVVAFGSAEAPVAVEVKDGTYQRVRIELTGLSSQQVFGATQQLSFGLKATPEYAR